jgi:hypothetical protein
MEQEKLPNSTIVLILGIVSIISCCCYGLGLIFGIPGIILANKDTALYKQNPEIYTGYSNIRTGRILSIIGVVLSALYLIAIISLYIALGEEGLLEMQQEMMKQYNV